MKICVLGCGLRTPLLLHGLVNGNIDVDELSLHDIEPDRADLLARLADRMAHGRKIRIRAVQQLDQAIEGSNFVVSCIRVGGMETRASDERVALESGFAGQETTGPAGFAMALRTVPVAIEHARIVERLSPSAWIINFTNPAGIITQAITQYTRARVAGICDTPAELFLQVARALGEPLENVDCEYFGLNHLGWIRSVRVRGTDATHRLLSDDGLLQRLYPAELFAPDLIRSLGLIPTEYLFFYYNQPVARRNQINAGTTRGEELRIMNLQLWKHLKEQIGRGNSDAALDGYRRYLNRRNASYMRLEAAGDSAVNCNDPDWNPFEAATGYHRIAIDTIRALGSSEPHSLILNVANRGAIPGIAENEIVEVPCLVDQNGPRPLAGGALPESVQGLLLSVKRFENLTIQAAMQPSVDNATIALMANPIVGSWDGARNFSGAPSSEFAGRFLPLGRVSVGSRIA